MAVSEAQKRAKAKYEHDKVRQKLVKFYPANTAELEQLERQPSQNAYVLALIRGDIEKSSAPSLPANITEYLAPIAGHRKTSRALASYRRVMLKLDAYMMAIGGERRRVHAGEQ